MSPLDDEDRRRQEAFLRDWRRTEQRRKRRQRRLALGAGLAILAVLVAGGFALALRGGDDPQPPPDEAAAPVRVELEPVEPEVEPEVVVTDDQDAIPDPPEPQPRTKGRTATAPADTPAAPAVPAAAAGDGPVVWIQAGHADPREPGYRDQTGASSGPFGNEIAFTTTLAPKVVNRLRRAGVDARQTPGEVTPLAAEGAAFVSLHSDIPQGRMALSHAITGAGENYYHGEGSGDPSPTPYPDSAPHRQATTVSGAVESQSAALATSLAATLQPIYTPANGAGASYGGIQTRNGNPRMMRYYGFYRTRADARVLIEVGAGGTDDAFLAKTDLIADAVSEGVLDHLRSRGLLAG
ncbi:MAG: hypothetical protein AB7I08_08670 [Thermoleophilia bacterium]